MELTAELLRRVIETPSNPEPSASWTEREQRRTPRTRLTMHAALMPFSERFSLQTVVAPIRDLSRGGFGFLHDREIPLGEQFAMIVPEDASGRPIVLLCTVAYYQPLAKGLVAIGARFCKVLRQGTADLPLDFEDAISGQRIAARIAS
jgi:hypothetical protein